MKVQTLLALSLILTTAIGVNVKPATAVQLDEDTQLTRGSEEITQTIVLEERRRGGGAR